MDASIFSCRELTSLDLSGDCEIPAAPPGLAGFPKLTRLCLGGVTFRDNGVRGLEALIAESPMLEVLLINDMWFPEKELEEWVIQAPNLRNLSIYSLYDCNWQIEYLPSIEEVEIMVRIYPNDRDFVKLLTRLARVRKLSFMMPLTEDNVLEGLSCSLDNLKDLSLRANFCSLPTILSLCQQNEMHLIEFVLSKAPRLQKLCVVANYDCPKSNEELLEELTRMIRAKIMDSEVR